MLKPGNKRMKKPLAGDRVGRRYLPGGPILQNKGIRKTASPAGHDNLPEGPCTISYRVDSAHRNFSTSGDSRHPGMALIPEALL